MQTREQVADSAKTRIKLVDVEPSTKQREDQPSDEAQVQCTMLDRARLRTSMT